MGYGSSKKPPFWIQGLEVGLSEGEAREMPLSPVTYPIDAPLTFQKNEFPYLLSRRCSLGLGQGSRPDL